MEKQSFSDSLVTICTEEGISGLWKGLRASLVLCINPAITYGCFEKLKGVLIARRGGEVLSSIDAFIIGALSKTLATVFTCTSFS
jgi:adenine nucleotide transporter 17